MDLKIDDVAELLNVSESTIKQWLEEGKIPSYRLHEQYRFSRIEIENWMMSFKQAKDRVSTPTIAEESKKGMQQYSLLRAIHKGGIYSDIPSTDKEQIIRDTMERVAPKLSLDAEGLTELLLDRESLMPTALNNGIAVPHPRDFLLKTPNDIVAVVTLKEPIDWGALDGQKVHTLFFLFATGDKRHLHLLAKLAHLSSNEEMLELFRSGCGKEELLTYLKDWEGSVRHLSD